MEKKVGLVLGGGGTKGAYQSGAIKALRNLGKSWDIVTGTSIGALNGCLVVQGDYDALYSIWDNVVVSDILNGAVDLDFNFEDVINKPSLYANFLKKYVDEKGADIEPFSKLLDKYLDKEKLMQSKIDYGCTAVVYPILKPVLVTKDMMYEKGKDYIISSASCFPIFPVHRFDDQSYIDGGYYDNLPIEFALDLGATEIIAVDLFPKPTHINFYNRENIKYIYPKHDIGIMFNFDREVIDRNIKCGFNDVYKAYGKYLGFKYTFSPFEKPSFFTSFYLTVMKLEIKISKMVNFKDDSFITNHFMKVQNKGYLIEEDLSFGIIDELMSILKMPVEDVYTFDKLALLILETFKNAFSEDFNLINISAEKINEVFNSFDRVGIISKIINQILYPEKAFVSIDLLLSVDPLVVAMAYWIIDMVKYVTES